MSDGNSEFTTTNTMMDRLADACWTQLADTPPRSIDIAEIADIAGVDEGAARAVAGSINALILHQLAQMDQLAVVESLADIVDAGDVTIREKIMEAMMHRFEIYAPYKAQIAQLDLAARTDPELGIKLLDSLVQAMRRILVMAGDDLTGWRGELRVRGVAAVAMLVAREWRNDETADLSATMKAIDARLSQGEDWGRTFRVFDGGGATGGEFDTGTEGAADGAEDSGFNLPSDERYQ